jgi:hypothetical protein
VSSRHDDIATFFAANAAALQRSVARHVVASGAVIEDACSIAWSKLLRRPDIRLGSDGFCGCTAWPCARSGASPTKRAASAASTSTPSTTASSVATT